MPAIPPFHASREAKKPAQKRVHHNNSKCVLIRPIPENERLPGEGGYRLCDFCTEETRRGH